MKKNSLTILCAAAALLLAAGCAKVRSSSTYEADKRYFDAWVQLNCPDAPQIGGVVVTSDEPGTGAEVADSTFIMLKFTAKTLDGTISETTEEEIARQLGVFSWSTYYGAQIWQTDYDALTVGVERGIKGSSLIEGAEVPSMRIGGKRTFITPVWLGGKTRYNSEEEYLSNSTSSENYIYEVEICDACDDILEWQLDTMKRFSELWLGGIDTTSAGFYYKQLREPADTAGMPNDTTIYVNYVGRLLNGKVFDTNIADTAKMYNIYSASRTYEPSEVTWNEESSNVKLGDSSPVGGWGKAISLMKHNEKGVTMFYSSLGYGSSGSGSSIPPYAPLLFEIELVDDPND